MVEKIDGNIPATLPVHPIARTVGGGAEPKAVSVQEKPAMASKPSYDLQLRVDRETSEVTAVLVNPETSEVVREIPAKEMHAASDVIRSLLGPLINKVA